MFAASPSFGPFSNLVGTAGSIVATAGALRLGFKGRARWEPSEQDVSNGPQRVGSLVGAVGVVLLWANSRADNMAWLTRCTIWMLGITVVSLVLYGLLNAIYVYHIEVATNAVKTERRNIIGGFWFVRGVDKSIRSLKVTVQEFLQGTGYELDDVWPRPSRALAKQAFVLIYLALTVCGTLALACASIITGFKVQH